MDHLLSREKEKLFGNVQLRSFFTSKIICLVLRDREILQGKKEERSLKSE